MKHVVNILMPGGVVPGRWCAVMPLLRNAELNWYRKQWPAERGPRKPRLCFSFLPDSQRAQTPTGSIAGVVRDPSGAAVPAARRKSSQRRHRTGADDRRFRAGRF